MSLFCVWVSKRWEDLDKGNEINCQVYVVAENDLEARKKAITVFKNELKNNKIDHFLFDFDRLDAMNDEERNEVLSGLVSEIYYLGAKGYLSCHNLGDVSGIIYDRIS